MTTITKGEPMTSDREVLTGLVERVTYQNTENGFCVLRVKARGQLVTATGNVETGGPRFEPALPVRRRLPNNRAAC